MKQSKKLSPLEELRNEKATLKQECDERENTISARFSYVSQNMGTLVIGSALSIFGIKKSFTSHANVTVDDEDVANKQDPNLSSSIMQTVVNGLRLTYPHIKDIVQPMLVGYAINKIKSLFSGKKGEKK